MKKFICLIMAICMLSTFMVALPISATESNSDELCASIRSVRCLYYNKKVTSQITFDYLAGAGMLYVAVYNGTQLVALQSKPVAADEYTPTVEITGANSDYANYKVKVFYWAAGSSLKPIAQSFETEIIPSSGGNHGFIIGVGKAESIGDVSYQVRLLDNEGNIKVYDFAESVRFASAYDNGHVSNAYAYDVYSYIVDEIGDNALIVKSQQATASDIDNYAKRVITYKTNSNGEISEIAFACERIDGKEAYLTYSGSVNQKITYNAETKTFGDVASVDEDTIVFNLPIYEGAVKSDFTLETTDVFAHGEKYDVAFLALNEDNYSSVMVVTSLPPKWESDTDSASAMYGFIVGAGTEYSAGETTYKMRLLNGKGDIAVYNLSEKIKSNIENFNITSGDKVTLQSPVNVFAAITEKALSNDFDYRNWIATSKTDDNIRNYANRIVTYKINSSRDISEIVFTSPRVDGNENYLTYTGDVSQGVTYNGETKTFADVASVDENTVVFNLPINDKSTKEDFSIDNIYTFAHNEAYDVAFLSKDENNLAKVVVAVNLEPKYEPEPDEPDEPEPQLPTYKYGYLIASGVNASSECAQFKIFTPDNKTYVLDSATKVKINGATRGYEEIPDILDSANDSLTNRDPYAINAHTAQLIKYTTNARGKIDNILTMQSGGDPQKALVLSSSYQENVTYTSINKMLGSNICLSTATKVIFVPEDRYETGGYSIGTYSKLKNGKRYAFEAYNCSVTNVPEVVVVYGTPAATGLNDVSVTFALVDSIKETLFQDGEYITVLNCKVDGADKVYYCKDSSLLTQYTKGDVLKLEFDISGYIRNVAPAFEWDNPPAEGSMFTYPYSEAQKQYVTPAQTFARYVYNYDNTNNYKTVYGTVYARDDERMTVTPYDIKEDGTIINSPSYTISYGAYTKFFVLDTTVSPASTNRLVQATSDSIAGYVSAKTGASKVYAYIRNNTTRFVLIIIE